MPAIPPGSVPRSTPESHQAREVAESFGSDAERYDRARPSYPAAMVDRIVAASPGPDVLDVGCGHRGASRRRLTLTRQRPSFMGALACRELASG
jgi:hypothetical protein